MSRRQEIEAGTRWIAQRLHDIRGYIADVRSTSMERTRGVQVSVWRVVELVATMAEREFVALQALPAHTREADMAAGHLLEAVQCLDRAYAWFMSSEDEAYHAVPKVLEAARLIGAAHEQLSVGAELTQRRTKPRAKRAESQASQIRLADEATPGKSSQALANKLGKPEAARYVRRVRAKSSKP